MDATVTDQRLCDLLDQAAAELRVGWAAAMDGGDFDRVASLNEASQAVHRALVALTWSRTG